MLLNIIFIHCISLTLANFDINQAFQNSGRIIGRKVVRIRVPRDNVHPKKEDFDLLTPNCEQMGRSSISPYVVMLLFKNSGNFLGMGSIVDKARVLTARRVIEVATYTPSDVLVLAGRLGPWWGKNSQVKTAEEIFQHDDGELAMVKLEEPFTFNINVAPIKLPIPKLGAIKNESFAIFGIPRSSVDVPGDPTPKTSMYFVSIEEPMETVDECIADLPDADYNYTLNFCTSTNGSYGWGCIGSPTVAVDKNGKVIQIGVVTHTAVAESDICHIHTKISPFTSWIRSHSLINYKNTGE